MRANRTLEIGTGLFVLLGFAALFFLTTQLPASGLKLTSAKAGYHVVSAEDGEAARAVRICRAAAKDGLPDFPIPKVLQRGMKS